MWASFFVIVSLRDNLSHHKGSCSSLVLPHHTNPPFFSIVFFDRLCVFSFADYTRQNYFHSIKILICGCAWDSYSLVLKTIMIMMKTNKVMEMMKCLQLMCLLLSPSPCNTTTSNLFSMTSTTMSFNQIHFNYIYVAIIQVLDQAI